MEKPIIPIKNPSRLGSTATLKCPCWGFSKKERWKEWALKKKRIEGLITCYTNEISKSWKAFESDFNQLSFQRKALIEIENKLEETKRKQGR